MNNVGNEIYSGLASYGQFVATIGLVIGVIIGIILLSVGIYLLVENSKKTYKNVKGTVLESPQCTLQGNSQGNNTYTCYITVQYQIDGQTKISRIISYNNKTQLNSGDTITLYYDSSNSNIESTLTTDNPLNTNILGWIFVGFGILLLVGSVVTYYLAQKSQTFAAFEGAENLFGGGFNNNFSGVGNFNVGNFLNNY